MKYKNALYILVQICLINITYGNHIGQKESQEGPEETYPIDATVLKDETINVAEETVDLISDNEDQQESSGNFGVIGGSLYEDTSEYTSEDTSKDTSEEGGDIIDNDIDESNKDHSEIKVEADISSHNKIKNSNCWMSINADPFFKAMNENDVRFASARASIQQRINEQKFTDKMLETMLSSNGAAIRETYKTGDRNNFIPAGFNLGGYCMMRMPDSVLFFHRMKLRNNTIFHINYMHNDLANMVLTARLSLNDLHLVGAFERSITDRDPSILFYAPSFGQVELLLQNVNYKMEGRYRLIKERLVIEVIVSEVIVSNVLMTYLSGAKENPTIKIDKETIEEFIARMKTDLDKWLKDYFNDYLIYTSLRGLKELDKLEKYDKAKAMALNEFMDTAMDRIRKRIRDQNATAIHVPNFTIMGVNGFQIDMQNGLLRGLDSIYRRSVATCKQEEEHIRKVDSLVGFSNLKVTYEYTAKIPTVGPSVSGLLTLSANDLAAHISLTLVREPTTVGIDIDFLDQTKPESLTVEGGANTMISNFKHLLEHQIIALMTNALVHGIKTLRSLPKCEPFLPGQIDSKISEAENAMETADQKLPETNDDYDLRKKNRGSKRTNKHSKKKYRSSKHIHRKSKNKHGDSKHKHRSSKKKHRHGR